MNPNPSPSTKTSSQQPPKITATSMGRPLAIRPLPRPKPPPVKPPPPTIGEILERAIRRLTERKGRLNFTLQELWEEELPRIREELPERTKHNKSTIRATLSSTITCSLIPHGIVSRIDRGVYTYKPSV